MERQRNEHETRHEHVATPEIVLRLKPDGLVPAEAQVAEWRARLVAEQQVRTAYCLGALMASAEGAAQAIEQGDGRWLTYHLASGLAAMAGYNQLAAEERLTVPVEHEQL